MSTEMPSDIQAAAISLIRGFAMDAPLHAKSGHQGTAMALAPLGHVLYSRVMKYDPNHPEWPDRDRFVLSNGHASILQYSMLYLAGLGLELADIKAFRSWESRTPGHPEAGHTPGVEVTTGPLSQGFGDAVGMAIAERFLRHRFGSHLVDHHTYVIAGDGCFMEGLSHEAASLAGHLGLGRLICIYDDNHITIDGPTSLAYSDDVGARFAAYGWNVVQLGEIAEDTDALEAALLAARAYERRPSLLILRSHVGFPSPDHTDDHLAHGNPFTADDVSRTKAVMGIPDEPFWAPPEVVEAYREAARQRCREAYHRWSASLEAIDAEERAEWDAAWGATGLKGWEEALPTFEQGEQLATRQAMAKVLAASLPHFPGIISGAADLTGNTGVKLPDDAGQQTAASPGGRQLYFGIREHAMGTALVGMARHGGILPLGGTFFAFLDYMREPVRLAALSHAKAIFVFSHDSVGVGEDGPTHQPVEHLATLRAIPQIQVIRPADGNETAAAWRAAVDHDGPTVLVLTRQGVTVCTDGSAVERGAGVVLDSNGDPALVIIATGSEVSLAVDAGQRLNADGVAARVVSLPSWDRFAAQGPEYRHELLPPGVPVLSVEAATTFGWERYADDSIGIDRFGVSAPGDEVLARLGINLDHVLQRAAPSWPDNAIGGVTASAGDAARMDGQVGRMRRQPPPDTAPLRRPHEGVDVESKLIRLYEEFGQSPWLDNLQRGYLTSGQLAALRDEGIRGLTSNPTIFQKAIDGSADYDEQFRAIAADDGPVVDDYWTLVTSDIEAACGVFEPVYDASSGGDGFVSVEVAPELADDSAGTEAAARQLHERIARRNLMVKIPGTAAGLAPIRQMITEGRNINVTLIFSLERHQEVMDAYLEGLEAYAATDGADLSKVASVASFFISRVDTEVDRRLEAIGTAEALALRGKAAVAQGKLAYAQFRRTFSGPRWTALVERGGRVQRPLWASTSTKNPAYPDTLYVDELIGPDTVNTLPDATIEAFADHGTLGRRIDADVEQAEDVWRRLAEVGVDMGDVAERLEREGVASFQKSFDELLTSLDAKSAELRAR